MLSGDGYYSRSGVAVEDLLNEFLEQVTRCGEANGTDSVPDQVEKACIMSNTPEPLKTHLQLNVGELGNFDALRVATEDYLRNRRIFKTTSNVNTMMIRWKSKTRARKVARKAKKTK